MADIKTREHAKDIKTIDRGRILAGSIRSASVRTRELSENLAETETSEYSSPSEYAQDKVKDTITEGGQKAASDIRHGAKDVADKGREIYKRSRNRTIKSVENNAKTVKQSARSSGKLTAKTIEKTAKTTRRSIKTASRSTKVAIKTAEKTAKAAAKAAEATAKTSARAAELARQAAMAAARAAAAAAKALAAAIKAIIAAASKLAAAIAAAGGTAACVVVIICMIAFIVCACTGVFFSSSDTGTAPMKEVVREINQDYQDKIDVIKETVPHGDVELSGSKAPWSQVLTIYSILLTTDKENPMEVATVTEYKKEMLKGIFWSMNEVGYSTETVTREVIPEDPVITDDTKPVNVPVKDDQKSDAPATETVTILKIETRHKSAEEMASLCNFDKDQMEMLDFMLQSDNSPLWAQVLYGVSGECTDIVEVALTQLGNVGGEPYWRYCGWPSRVEWCACFVTWCANECGYVEEGLMPMTSSPWIQTEFFKERGQWMDGGVTPAPGMIIFFDWKGAGTFPDHVAIVEYVADGYVHTVEGNSGDSCCQQVYPIGSNLILGYGVIGAE